MGCIGSCIGSCAASCCCAAVSKSCGFVNSKSERFHKLPYTILIFFSVLAAIILRNYKGDFLVGKIYHGVDMTYHYCDDTCKGDQAVYRICLSLTIFFAFHTLLLFAAPAGIGYEFHTSFFGAKLIAFTGVLIGMFYVDIQSMNDFANTCRIVSLAFIVFQTVAIIDYAYTLHFWMVDRRVVAWDIANLSLSGLILCVSLIMIGFMFHWFAGNASCHMEKFVLSMTIIVPAVFTTFACTEYIPHGALFPSACITGYAVYLAFTALVSDTDRQCNSEIQRAESEANWEMAIGIIIAAVSITFTTWSMGESSSKLFGQRGDGDEKEHFIDGKNKDENDMNLDGQQDEEEEEELAPEVLEERKKAAYVFHLLMTLASMYACMLLTSWSTQNYEAEGERYQSNESFWVKVTSQWFVLLLYVWTLTAPIMFPDRDFT